ncbi:hypothetical protein ASF80_06710 [Microbacterium sp. Leaf159]|nr:hypothetical protein ASF80_06710 [Microbacterium sp. Leaf159]
MFEDELRALITMPSFSDPASSAREAAVNELRQAIKAVREIPGWSGDSVGNAQQLLDRMEENAAKIATALADMRTNLQATTSVASEAAADSLGRLPSASADGFLADAGRNLSGITDGWGALDTGELVAQEEARLAAERETAAMNELKTIRSTLTGQATQNFGQQTSNNVDTTSVPLPVIDVEGIDSRVPPVGSNGPSGGPGTSPGGTGVGSVAPPQVGTWVPGGGGDGGWVNGGNGGSGGGNTGTIGDNGWDNGDNGGSGGNGGSDPSVDSPNGGTLPGYPGIGGGGGGGGLLAGGSGGSGTLGAAVVGGAGAAALMGARSASLNGAGGAGLFGGGGSGAGAGAATAGRGLLGMGGATGPGGLGAAGSASGSATGAAGGTTAGAGGRSMAPGMMGGAAGDDEKRRDRSGLGGPIAPKLEDDEEVGPRSRSAQAGSRDTLG